MFFPLFKLSFFWFSFLISKQKKTFFSKGWHQITGSIAFTFALIQPIGALFRPLPDAGNRWLFNWLHWFGGTFGHILATAAILLTSRFKLLNLPQSFLYIALAWIISHVIHHLLFQFVSFCSFGSSKLCLIPKLNLINLIKIKMLFQELLILHCTTCTMASQCI